MKRPKWQIKFKDLPIIPKSKRWINGDPETMEHRISKKLFAELPITKEEEEIMKELTLFYEILSKSLESVDYTTFTKQDFKNFKNYIFYAFNYTVILTNRLTVFQTFRMVINENVLGEKKSLNKKRFLSYPPEHVVKEINKFNRANTPGSSVFYGSETIDGALNELKPQVGDLVSVGVYEPVREKKFIAYPISHSEQGYGVNEQSTCAMEAFKELKGKQSKLLADFIEPYLHILGHEFSKTVKHHYEYLISSLFSEKILSAYTLKNTRFDIECIVYPSVGHKFLASNLAIRKDVFKRDFKLTKVREFVITETFYDDIFDNPIPDQIKVVGYKDHKETTTFDGNEIIWEKF